MTQEKARIPYFDFLRGIAILLVVSIHTFGLFPVTDNLWGEIKLLLSQVIQCAVPLFLAISGFFLAKKQAKYTTLLKRQIPRVYIPVLIWSLPFYIKALNGGYNSFTATVICLACGFSIYYFVAVIMQLYILSHVLYKFNKLGGCNFFLSDYSDRRIVRGLRTEHRRRPTPTGIICRTVPRMAGFFPDRHVARQPKEQRLQNIALCMDSSHCLIA